MLAVLGPLTVDLYLPAFPLLQRDLDTSAAAVQLTLTATTIGFALGQLVVGRWSDAAGRRVPLLLATAVHVVASIGVALSPDVALVLVFRVLQGAGAAGGGVIATAIIRDLYSGGAFITGLARIQLVTGLAPVVAPVLGVPLLGILDWRGLFVVVAAYGAAALLLAACLLRETLPPERRQRSGGDGAQGGYLRLLRDRSFVGVALIGGLIVSGVFTYMASASFLMQTVYGLDANGYSVVFAANALSFVVGTQVAARILLRVEPQRLLAVTLPLLALAGFAAAMASALGLGLVGVVVPCTLFMLIAGASVPGLPVIGLAYHGDRAATAAAMLGAANFGLAGVTAPLVGLLGVDSAVPMGLVMGAAEAVAVLVFLLLVRRRGNRPAAV
jgi:DHA1 family bicyclomycin/chloramphenicol resistance-like MFS transporter